jgi:hypothetical protein
MRNAYKISVSKLEGKRLPGSPKRRYKNIIKMDLEETGCE